MSTYKNTISIFNQFKMYLNDRYGDGCQLLVGDITKQIVRGFLEWGSDRKRKKVTIEKYLELICKVCRHASDDGMLPESTAKAITGIKLEDSLDDADNEKIKYLIFDELRKLKHYDANSLTKRQSDYLQIFFFAFFTGLRISDTISLKWRNVDFDKKKIRKVLVKPHEKKRVPLRDEAIMILEKWRGRNRTFCFDLLPANFDLKDEEEFRIRRNSITSNINKCLKRIAKVVGIDKNLTFHMARHSFSVLCLEQGMPIPMISKCLGHATPEITSRVYACYTDDATAKAVNDLKFDL